MQIVLNGVGVFSHSSDTENMQLHNSNRQYPMLATLFYCFVLLSDPIHFLYSRASIELGDITPHNLKQLRVLNTVVFPVSYNDKFYIDVLEVRDPPTTDPPEPALTQPYFRCRPEN